MPPSRPPSSPRAERTRLPFLPSPPSTLRGKAVSRRELSSLLDGMRSIDKALMLSPTRTLRQRKHALNAPESHRVAKSPLASVVLSTKRDYAVIVEAIVEHVLLSLLSAAENDDTDSLTAWTRYTTTLRNISHASSTLRAAALFPRFWAILCSTMTSAQCSLFLERSKSQLLTIVFVGLKPGQVWGPVADTFTQALLEIANSQTLGGISRVGRIVFGGWDYVEHWNLVRLQSGGGWCVGDPSDVQQRSVNLPGVKDMIINGFSGPDCRFDFEAFYTTNFDLNRLRRLEVKNGIPPICAPNLAHLCITSTDQGRSPCSVDSDFLQEFVKSFTRLETLQIVMGSGSPQFIVFNAETLLPTVSKLIIKAHRQASLSAVRSVRHLVVPSLLSLELSMHQDILDDMLLSFGQRNGRQLKDVKIYEQRIDVTRLANYLSPATRFTVVAE